MQNAEIFKNLYRVPSREISNSLLKATIAYRLGCPAWFDPVIFADVKTLALEFSCHRFLIHGEFEYLRPDDKGRFGATKPIDENISCK